MYKRVKYNPDKKDFTLKEKMKMRRVEKEYEKNFKGLVGRIKPPEPLNEEQKQTLLSTRKENAQKLGIKLNDYLKD